MKSNIKKVVIGISLLAIFLVVAANLYRYNLALKWEQRFSECFNQIPENPDPEDVIGLSLANISSNEEKEIQEIIKKALEGQYLFRYYYINEDEMDELIGKLYVPEEYQRFKKEIKEEYKYINRENIPESTFYSIKGMRFSKPRKYKDLNDRVGIMGESEFVSTHYFLFKKINNQWKIEKEILPTIKPCFTDETPTIQHLLEQKNIDN